MLNPTQIQHHWQSIGDYWNKERTKEPVFLLDLIGISRQQPRGVVGVCWIEQGAQTGPERGGQSVLR